MKTAKELQIGAKRVHAPLRAGAESSASTPRPLSEFATLNWRETTVLLDFDLYSMARTPEKERHHHGKCRDEKSHNCALPQGQAGPHARSGPGVHAHQPTQAGGRAAYARVVPRRIRRGA